MNKKQLLSSLMVGACALSFVQKRSFAESIVPDNYDNPQLNSAGLTLTTGQNGLQGYLLPQPEVNGVAMPPYVAELPSYISVASLNNNYSAGDGAIINIDGTAYQAGFFYTDGGSGTNGAYQGLANFTVGSGAPASFTVGILVDAAGPGFGPGINSSIQATLSGAASFSQTVQVTDAPSPTRDADNDFYFVTVLGAQQGDTLSFTASDPNDFATLDGFTFGTAVPEPGSCALLMGGIGYLATLRRSRRHA
jgi:hypothetical protein